MGSTQTTEVQPTLVQTSSIYVPNATPHNMPPTNIHIHNSMPYTVSMPTHTPSQFQGVSIGSTTPQFSHNPTYATTTPATIPFSTPNQIFIPPFNSFTYQNHIPPLLMGSYLKAHTHRMDTIIFISTPILSFQNLMGQTLKDGPLKLSSILSLYMWKI